MTAPKKKRLVRLEANAQTTIETKIGRDIIETSTENEAVDDAVVDASLFARVGAEFSRTLNTGDFTSVRIASSVEVCCECNVQTINKRSDWAENFVKNRVNKIALDFEQ
jgi:hypothetical protein